MFGLSATVLISILSSVGSGLLAAYNKSKDVTISAITATASVASAQASYMREVLGHPLSPPSIACYGAVGWYFKASFLDNVFAPALGYSWYTPPLTGGTQEITMIIFSGMFFSGIAAILKR
jgi:hypothetical protein